MGNIADERLKLLYVFKFLFEERSVVKAAQRLSATQSAVSKQLKKLRQWFDDELFVRTAEGMEPTEKALQLVQQIDGIIEQIEDLNSFQAFCPSRLGGEVVVETTDEVSRRIVPGMLQRIAQRAPNLTLRIQPLERQYSLADLESGSVDVVISVNWHAPEKLLQKRLASDQFVVLMHARHPLARQTLKARDYAEARHLLVAPLSMRRGYVDELLEQQGLRRRVYLVVPSFGEITPRLLEEGFIVTLPNQVAIGISKQADLVIRSLPFDIPMFNYYMLWHRRFTNNQRHMWIRDSIEDVYAAASVPAI